MLKNVEDSGSPIEELDNFTAKDESVENDAKIIKKESKKPDEPIIRKVRFARTDIEIQEFGNILTNDSRINGSGSNETPVLASILKSTTLYPLPHRKKSYDSSPNDSLSKVQNPNQSNQNLNYEIDSSQITPKRKKARGRPRLEDTSSLKQNKTLNSENSRLLDDKNESEDEKSLPQSSNASYSQTIHNTRRKSRRSPVPEIELLNDSSGGNRSEERDSPIPNGSVYGRGRGRGRARGRGKARGRGRGKSFGVDNGDNSVDNLSGIIEEVEEDSAPPKIEGQVVKCARCGTEMPKNKWNAHNLSLHNNMGWEESSTPLDFENDQKLLTRVLVNAHKRKKGVLTCEKCGTAKRSVVGFISHLQFCGKSVEEKSALLMTCPICHRTMMPSSLEVHHRVHKQPAAEPGNSDITGSVGTKTVPTGSKRKAAERAITRISEFTALVREDEGTVVKKPRSSSPTIKKMIQRPQLKKTIPGVLRALWKKEISNNGEAFCRQPGCTAKFHIIDELYKHYSTCNFIPRTNFMCKVCKFDSESESEILNHVAEHHSSDIVSNNESESDESIDSGESENEHSKRRHQSTSRLSHHWRGRPKSWHKIEFLSKEETLHLNKPYLPSVKWTLEFELENYQLDLFSNLVPNSFELLNEEEAAGYLPELEISMATQKMHMKRYNENIQSSGIEWKRWKRFEGDIDDGMPTFFVGGPVWAISWLPIPTGLFAHEVDQYLAISTHPTMESEYSLGRSYLGKNIVQIWNVGKLSNKGGCVDGLPKLAYAIAHTSGTIWCMEWCPSGCYQDQILSNYGQKNGQQTRMRRMGLLATACSDGCVKIYSMPFPEELEFYQISENRQRIFKTEPVVTLVVNSIMYDNGKQNWQCTKLNWTKENGHDTIVAGFSNGYVALWKLTTKSPLLLKNRGTTTFINAFRHFFAHGHAVSAVSLVPYGGKRFLATAGLDRYYKFWDLENTSGPQGVLKRGVVVDGTWLTHWPAAVNSFDDVLGLNHTCTNLISLREYGYRLCLGLATNSPVYTVSVSDYGNAIAHGTLAGEVQTAFTHQLLVGIDVDRTVARKRRLNSFVKIVDLCETEEIEEKSSAIQKNTSKKHSEDYKYMPDTYQGCKDRFGIIFYDMPSEYKEHIPTEIQKKTLQTDELTMVPLESYPFTSVNKVSWNPNAWSYLWLATGYQCGIIRISCFKSMYIPATIKDLLPKHADRIFAKENEQGS